MTSSRSSSGSTRRCASSCLRTDGGLNRFVNVYVNGRDVRYEQDLATPVTQSDTIILLPAMAGG